MPSDGRRARLSSKPKPKPKPSPSPSPGPSPGPSPSPSPNPDPNPNPNPNQARETFFCADPGCTFAYVGLRLPPAAWPAAVLQARAAVARALGCSLSLLSACLANNYHVGAGSIPWHYDEV